MKIKYLIPITEVTDLRAESLLASVSGAGLNEGGTDDGSHTPRAPGKLW